MLSKTSLHKNGSGDTADSETQITDGFTTTVVVLEPGHVTSIGLGAYGSAEAIPVFELSYEPDMKDVVGVSLERLDIPGKSKYVPFYQLHNFGDKTCKITVRRVPSDSQQRKGN